jgi:hypothetical protein
MSKKPSPAPRIAPLQRIAAEPILDPTEQAGLDELRKQRRQQEQDVDAGDGGPAPNLVSRVEALWRRLPLEERTPLLIQLVVQSSLDGQFQLLDELAAHLPLEALRRLEQALHARVGNGSP